MPPLAGQMLIIKNRLSYLVKRESLVEAGKAGIF